jgi:hypothetical protein
VAAHVNYSTKETLIAFVRGAGSWETTDASCPRHSKLHSRMTRPPHSPSCSTMQKHSVLGFLRLAVSPSWAYDDIG